MGASPEESEDEDEASDDAEEEEEGADRLPFRCADVVTEEERVAERLRSSLRVLLLAPGIAATQIR